MIETIIAIELAVALVVLALIFRFRARRWRHGAYFLFKRLRTTPGQEKVIRTALSRMREAGRLAARETKESRPELAELIRSQDFDESTARTWFASRERTLENLKPNLIESMREIHSVLDDDQRQLLARAVESGRFGFSRHHHPHHGC